jgi:hypothetical protein
LRLFQLAGGLMTSPAQLNGGRKILRLAGTLRGGAQSDRLPDGHGEEIEKHHEDYGGGSGGNPKHALSIG